MADEKADPQYPPPSFPNAFADGITAMANTPAFVKFFLGRFEPDMLSIGPHKLQPFAQIVMPMLGFVHAFTFFEARMKVFLEQGIVTQAQIDDSRKTLPSEKK